MTTKEPMPFDGAKHKFGMAYRDSQGQILYVGDHSHSMGFLVRYLDGGEFSREVAIPRGRKLYRAPEYDLTISAPDKIVIDRAQLEGMRKSVPESKDRFNFYDFENATTWNACIDAIIAAQVKGE